MSKFKPNKNYNPNEVDTGFIYNGLCYQYENYPKKTYTMFRSSLMGLLIEKKIVTLPYNAETMETAKDLEKYWDANISKEETQYKVDYFCFSTSELGQFITSYYESCIVCYGDSFFGWDSFDFYFALKLNLTDLIKLDDFLDYQLDKYFKDIKIFKRFLEQIVRKYQNEFLSKEVIETVNTWIPKKNIIFESPVSWIGKNETEFVQFVYALKEAGLIKHTTGQTEKLVDSMAMLFNFELGKNWKSNLAKSINSSNNDYEPKIFDKLRKAYNAYVIERLDRKDNR